MDLVNATLAGLPKPLQWALRLIFRRSLKAKVHKEKPAATTSPERGPDPSISEASFSQQSLNSDKMTKTQADTMRQAEKRADRTAWGVAWLVFLLSIIPVTVLTLSLLAVAGCTSASPGIPEIYLFSLDTVSSGISLRIGYAGICAVRDDGPTTCTATTAWSNPEDVSAALFQPDILQPKLQEKNVVVSIQSYEESDHTEDTTAVLDDNACAAIGEEELEAFQSEPTTVISSSASGFFEAAMPSTITTDSAFFPSSFPETISTSATTTHSAMSQPPLTSSPPAPLEPTTSWSAQPVRPTSVFMLPVLTTASTTALLVFPTSFPSPSPPPDAGPPTEDPSPPPPTPNFDPIKATALALSYQRAEPPFCVLTIVFFLLALIQFALLHAMPHHIPRLRPFVARNKRGIRVVAWILMLVALLMGGLGTEWACWYASRAGSVVEVDPRLSGRGHATRDVVQRYQLRYGGSRALFLLQLFAEMAMLLPVVCVLITTVEVWVMKVKSGGGEIEKAKNVEDGADQEMDNLGLAEEGRSRDRREAEDGSDDRSSSDSESSQHLKAPPRQSEKCSVISVSLSDTHNPEEASTPAQPKPVARVSRDSTTPHHIPRVWTGATTNSFSFPASQYSCSEFGGPDDAHWCDASPVHVAKGAKLVDIGSLRKRGGD